MVLKNNSVYIHVYLYAHVCVHTCMCICVCIDRDEIQYKFAKYGFKIQEFCEMIHQTCSQSFKRFLTLCSACNRKESFKTLIILD